MVRINAQVFQIEQGVVRRDPFWLIECSPPMAIGFAFGQEAGSPALMGNAAAEVRTVRFEKIPVRLILNGDVPLKEPISDCIVCHEWSNQAIEHGKYDDPSQAPPKYLLALHHTRSIVTLLNRFVRAMRNHLSCVVREDGE